MAVVNFQQEDTAALCGTVAGCSGKTLADTPFARLSVDGGTAGTVELSPKSSAGELDRAAVMFEMVPPNGASWDAGDYVIRLNVTTAHSLATWIATYVCRFNSSCVNQETIGSLTGQSTSLGSTGVKTHTVPGSAVTPSADDKVYVILVVDFGADHGNIAFGFTPDQLIDTPIDVVGVTLTPAPAVAAFSSPIPTVVPGPVTLNPAPVTAAFSVPTAVITPPFPATIATSKDLILARGQNRIDFRNPRGTQRRYAFYQDTTPASLFYAWSSNGETWNEVNPSISAGWSYDIRILEDGAGSQLEVFLVMHRGNNVVYFRGTIADASDTIVWGSEQLIVSTTSILPAAANRPVIVLTRTQNGRLVVVFTEDIANGNGDMRDVRIIGADGDSASPTWSGETLLFDTADVTNNADKGDVWMAVDAFTGGTGNRFVVVMRVPDGAGAAAYAVQTAVPEWNGTSFSNLTLNNLGQATNIGKVLSCLVDSDDRTHLIRHDSNNLVSMRAATVREDDWQAKVNVNPDVTDVDACTLTIDLGTSPDTLYAVYHESADATDFIYRTSPVDTIVWSAENVVTFAEDVVALSSALVDQVGALHIIGERDTDVVFYHTIAVGAGPQTLSPAPVTAAFSVPTPTVSIGTVTLQPIPAVAAFGVPAPTLLSPKTLSPAPATAAWSSPAPTISPGPVTLSPGPTSATWVVPAPTLSIGAVTLQPTPTIANWVVPTPVVLSGITLSPAPVVANWAAPTPTLTAGPLTLTPVPTTAAWGVPTPTVQIGAVTLSPVPTVATWVVPAATIFSGITLSPAPAVAAWSAPIPTVSPGPLTLSPVPTVATWSAPVPTVVIGPVTLSPAPTVAVFVVPAPTILAGLNLTPAPVIAIWTVPAPVVVPGPLTLAPGPVAAAWTVVVPTLVPGALTLSPAPAVATWVVPAVTIVTGLTEYGSSGFDEPDVGTSLFDEPDVGESSFDERTQEG